MTGSFTAGHALHVQVRMDFEGDMTLDATASDIEMSEIVAYDTNDATQSVMARMTEQGRANSLTVSGLAWNDDITFELVGPESGNFDLHILCESDAVCVH